MNERPRFNTQTGEPIIYDDEVDTTVSTEDGQDVISSSEHTQEYEYYDVKPQAQAPKTARELKVEAKAARKEARKAARQNNGGFGYCMKLVASAIVFGLIAGLVMFGVNRAGEVLDPRSTSVSQGTVSAGSGNTSNGSGSNSITIADSTSYTSPVDVKSIVKAAMPSVVAINGKITVSTGYSYFYPFGGVSQESSTSGTGIIVGKNDTELLIVTNAHVVDGVNDLTCTFSDNEAVSATVKGSKTDKDIAVIAVKLSDIKSSTLSSIAIATLGDSSSVELGDQVIAIGNALGKGQSVTVGYISALNRSITIDGTEYSNLMMTDAAINPGNSGGALLDSSGRVIGINSAKYASEEVEGMGYAIPISSIRDVLDTLMTKETRSKVSSDKASFLGITGIDITAAMTKAYGYPQGIMVQSAQEGTPAANAGIGKNDIIVSFAGDSVLTFEQLKSTMEYYAAGEKVTIEYYHMESGEYKLKSVEVTLASKSNQK